ncbi:MAG: hypothetical protein JJT78_01330 [Leptospira sp.]|nr:hypothetical protein [Leptospira sp.]
MKLHIKQKYSKIIKLFLIGLVVASLGHCFRYIGLASNELRSHSQEMTSKALDPARSFLKAKQWFKYRLEGTNAEILVDDQANGILSGKGFLMCRVPYGVDKVDVEFHEFNFAFLLKDKTASIRFDNIYSYSRDPNDITISYGPRSEREAKITIRKCFEPLAEDLFGYIQ